MYSIYFAVISALTTDEPMPSYAFAMLDGEFETALRHSTRQTDPDGAVDEELRVLACQATADASLLLGRDEDAEEHYRKAQKLLRGSNEQLRVFSCRNTGWQALAMHRYSAALHCFSRISQEGAASGRQKIEAALGVAIIHHLLGQQDAADEALAHARALTASEPDGRWLLLTELLAVDFAVQLGVRCSAVLRDHAFWQSVMTRGNHMQLLRDFGEHMGRSAAGRPTPELVARHAQYLALLTRLAAGERDAGVALAAHAASARKWECHAYSNGVRLEIALAALAGDCVDLAEQTLQRSGPGNCTTRRWNLDYLYCQAKICMQRGYVAEAMKFYASYTHDALQCLRNETQVIKSLDGSVHNAVALPTDDVSARLPAKYRRAYRYIVEHFTKNDLCTREIAAQIGVTERALQMAFREHLGMSPSAVVRRLRLEAIRADLQDEGQAGANIIKTANRWGLKSRSALIRGYRKQFQESPSETSCR
ncbi:AraC family transcriptional regulator [Duganella sp. BJB488]|uniref:helix-turn-helix transcriptional regulator n=1 Tax=unclassified Duganella TaxID=2636909 RepID=UPI000E3433B9|nr:MULTISPECIES: helix-turn-helix transcriptional regulator [unclassified Duganella]RFP09339.1 AraC family transcriptional regulator [Duganella sp. BJB475]RFP13227.1 AraC family transcriptional regulator [Duganella sp. BJB489]RFP17198.1 AraC family transcriptional regulator [Duganella sp. BJB488]RFP25375.1 AraC family transcriptional regulator [Duganella sp. BJB476]RFP31582.1 AraC family transcriptional regulator [Duganella sp. BJB480]